MTPLRDTFTSDVEAAAAYERHRAADDHWDDRPTAADLADADDGPPPPYDARWWPKDVAWQEQVS